MKGAQQLYYFVSKNQSMEIKILLPLFHFSNSTLFSQKDQLVFWYWYNYPAKFKESKFGIQGDIQYRNNTFIDDLEQLLLKSELTYNPKNTYVMVTLGFANITTVVFGESNDDTNKNRIYQEVLLPQKVSTRIYLTHRFRYNQRFVEKQDFRTRYRYNLLMKLAVNKTTLSKNAIYLAPNNELFINVKKNNGSNRRETVFDRNRFYLGLGYRKTDKIKV